MNVAYVDISSPFTAKQYGSENRRRGNASYFTLNSKKVIINDRKFSLTRLWGVGTSLLWNDYHQKIDLYLNVAAAFLNSALEKSQPSSNNLKQGYTTPSNAERQLPRYNKTQKTSAYINVNQKKHALRFFTPKKSRNHHWLLFRLCYPSRLEFEQRTYWDSAAVVKLQYRLVQANHISIVAAQIWQFVLAWTRHVFCATQSDLWWGPRDGNLFVA